MLMYIYPSQLIYLIILYSFVCAWSYHAKFQFVSLSIPSMNPFKERNPFACLLKYWVSVAENHFVANVVSKIASNKFTLNDTYLLTSTQVGGNVS